MSRYAEGTEVSPERTVASVKQELLRFGASGFGQVEEWEAKVAGVAFVVHGVRYQMNIPLPDPAGEEFRLTPSRQWERSEAEASKLYSKEVARRWRALLLVVKAKLVAVRDGVATFETEFLPYAMLADGRTVGEAVGPKVLQAAREGRLATPQMLALPEGDNRRER